MSIFLHIGVGKTGTSSLQTFLAKFSSNIEAQGFHILKTGCDTEIAAHHLLALSFSFSKKNNDECSEDMFNALKQEVLSTKQKHIIISSETFHSHVTDKKLYNLSQALSCKPVKVILYVRRQEEWIDSAYRQFAEMDNTFSVETIIGKAKINKAIDYKWQVDMWEKYFGSDSVILRVYESGQSKCDTIKDFTQILGLNMTTEMNDFDTISNPSLSPAEAEILRIINCISENKKQTRDEVLKVLRQDKSINHSGYHFMSEQIRSDLRTFYAEGNAELAKKYFSRTDGRLFLDPPKH